MTSITTVVVARARRYQLSPFDTSTCLRAYVETSSHCCCAAVADCLVSAARSRGAARVVRMHDVLWGSTRGAVCFPTKVLRVLLPNENAGSFSDKMRRRCSDLPESYRQWFACVNSPASRSDSDGSGLDVVDLVALLHLERR